MARQKTIDFTMDTSKFIRDLNRKSHQVLTKSAPDGMVQAVKVLHEKTDNEVPRTPQLTGDLRASAKEEVRREAFGAIVGVLSYNTKYAAKWHEYPDGDQIKWTLPGSGTKYIEAKLNPYKDQIFAPIAKVIRAVM